jgi:hypothetical protein
MNRLVVLSVATQGAEGDAGQSLRESGLIPDDWASLILLNEKQIPDETLEAILAEVGSEPTALLDTHPSNGDRIARARAIVTDTLFSADAEATVLFDHLEELSKQVTVNLYRNSYGIRIKPDMLQPVAAIASRHQEEKEGEERMLRYFQGHFSPLRPFPLSADAGKRTAPAEKLVQRIRAMHVKVVEQAKRIGEAGDRLGTCEERLVKCMAGHLLVKAKLSFDKKAFGLAKASAPDATRAIENAQAAVEKELAVYSEFDDRARERLEAGILLFNTPGAAEKIDAIEEQRKELRRMFPALNATDGVLGAVDELQAEFQSLVLFLNAAGDTEPDARFTTTLQNAMKRLRGKMKQIREQLGEVDYPFEHAKGKISLAAYALKRMPRSDDLGDIAEACEGLVGAVLNLRYRIFSKLVGFAVAAEGAHRIEALPKPTVRKAEA